MLVHLLCQHGGVLHGMPQQEGSSKASTEGGLRLCDALLSTCHLHSSTWDESWPYDLAQEGSQHAVQHDMIKMQH